MRIRLRYSKSGKVRFVSHRDLARVFERAIRKLGLPVAYSEGFSPRPKLHFGLALSTGYESICEYLDIDLLDDLPDAGSTDVDPAVVGQDAVVDEDAVVGLLAELPDQLTEVLPTGVVVHAVEVLEPKTQALMDVVTSSTWVMTISDGDSASIAATVERTLTAEELPVELVRKGKPVREDLRPLILDLRVEPTTSRGEVILVAELGTKPRSVRPAELLDALGLAEASVRICRTHQWITSDGERSEPMSAAAPSPHAQARAS